MRVGPMKFRDVVEYMAAEPFRPYRIYTVSGQDYEVRHSELAK